MTIRLKKRAGKCFNEAKLYQVSRKNELRILMETYLNKMVQIRVMEYLRVKAKSVVPAVEQAELTFRRLGSHT